MPKKDKEKKEIPAEEVIEETVETPAEETPAEPEVNPFEEKYNAEHDAHLRLAAEYDNFRKPPMLALSLFRNDYSQHTVMILETEEIFWVLNAQ